MYKMNPTYTCSVCGTNRELSISQNKLKQIKEYLENFKKRWGREVCVSYLDTHRNLENIWVGPEKEDHTIKVDFGESQRKFDNIVVIRSTYRIYVTQKQGKASDESTIKESLGYTCPLCADERKIELSPNEIEQIRKHCKAAELGENEFLLQPIYSIDEHRGKNGKNHKIGIPFYYNKISLRDPPFFLI